MKLNRIPAVLATLAAANLFGALNAGEVATSGAEVGKWTMDYPAAEKLAAEKDLPLLLNFTGSDWCGWCKLMDGNVFAEEKWEKFAAENIVLATIDFPRDKSIVPEKFVSQNAALKEKFSVQGYPTYIILESDGETVLGQLGAGKEKTPESFIEELNAVLRFRPSSIKAKVAQLGPARGAEYEKAISAVKSTENDLREWLKTRPVRNEENDKKFAAFQKSIEDASKQLDSF